MSEKLPPIHPGEILTEEFLAPLGMNPRQLAQVLKVPPNRINQIVNRQRAVTADTARRLGRYFGTGPEFWMNLQTRYELETLEDRCGHQIDTEVVPRQVTA